MNSAKAILSAVLAGLAALIADLRGADASLTFRDWLVILLAALVAGVGTYLVPPGPGLRTPPAPPRGQHGAISFDAIAVAAAGAFIGIGLLYVVIQAFE